MKTEENNYCNWQIYIWWYRYDHHIIHVLADLIIGGVNSPNNYIPRQYFRLYSTVQFITVLDSQSKHNDRLRSQRYSSSRDPSHLQQLLTHSGRHFQDVLQYKLWMVEYCPQ